MLIEIKQLLIERQEMSLVDLAKHFHVSESVMVAMMDKWMKKGCVDQVESNGFCGSRCGSCNESSDIKTVYRWKKVMQKPIFAKTDH